MTIMITLQQIKNASPCEDGWKRALKANGGSKADMTKPFPLVSVLDSNDLNDTLWVICNVPEMKEYDDIWRKFASFCALQNVEKIAKYCSSEDYNLIVKWLETNDADLREPAWSAAESAAESAARSAAESAAWSAAWSAAEPAAESAAYAAAWSAAEPAAESAAEVNLRKLIS